MAEKLTPNGLVVGLIPEEELQEEPKEEPEKEPEKAKGSRGRKASQK